MARTPLMAGNWKMNLNHVEATGLVQKLAWTLADGRYDKAKSECAVIVPFTDIRTVQTLIEAEKYPIAWGAQDVSVHASGAYTGEISTDMLSRLGCAYVVVGHSERREYHGETDELVNAKARRILDARMTPIVCVGEKLEIRKAG
ncbi:MAG TPA: triose-phosphate isomerase, partial [Propionibacteriaceae bacterium]|nr:triose-phosphate isomerase [Propionibacteriaceae bacterium]